MPFRPGFPFLHSLLGFAQLMPIESMDHPNISFSVAPFSFCPSLSQHQGLGLFPEIQSLILFQGISLKLKPRDILQNKWSLYFVMSVIKNKDQLRNCPRVKEIKATGQASLVCTSCCSWILALFQRKMGLRLWSGVRAWWSLFSRPQLEQP